MRQVEVSQEPVVTEKNPIVATFVHFLPTNNTVFKLLFNEQHSCHIKYLRAVKEMSCRPQIFLTLPLLLMLPMAEGL